MSRSLSRWQQSLASTPERTILDKAADQARMRAAIRDHRARRIKAQYAGWCEACGHPVPVGTSIWWSNSAGVMHEECVELEPYHPATGAELREWEAVGDAAYRRAVEEQEANEALEARLMRDEP